MINFLLKSSCLCFSIHLAEVSHVLLYIGELLAAVLAEMPGTEARVPAHVTELELAPAAVDPVIVVGFGFILHVSRIRTMMHTIWILDTQHNTCV